MLSGVTSIFFPYDVHPSHQVFDQDNRLLSRGVPFDQASSVHEKVEELKLM